MVSKELKELVEASKSITLKRTWLQKTADEKFEVACHLHSLGNYAQFQENEGMYALKECYALAKGVIEKLIRDGAKKDLSWLELDEYCKNNGTTHPYLTEYYNILKDEAYLNFESFMFYMEQDRNPEKRFYAPRCEVLHQVAMDLSNLDAGVYNFYGLSMPPRIGKSTICIFFLAWVLMKRPTSNSAMCGHSGTLAKGFYKEILNLLTTDEYRFKELFDYYHPEYKKDKFPQNQSAEDLTVTIAEASRFASFTARGIDGTWTGAINISGGSAKSGKSNIGYLYVDDLIRDREHSLSPTRMENTYQEMLNKCFDRLNDGAKVLMVGTLWSVLDPLERMRVEHENDPKYKFRRIPALDENDESNFRYKINGFSTNFYLEMRERLEDAEWQAKYQQKPYVREGLLFPADELQYFNGILPEGDSRVVAVCDTSFGGGDYLSMPIGREYENGNVYIFDWIYNNGVKEVTIPEIVGKIIENEIRQCRFESNTDNGMFSEYVDEELRKRNYKCSCTAKKAPNTMAKQEKIIAYSGDIKRRFFFLQPNGKRLSENTANSDRVYRRSREYQKAMDDLGMYVTVGKNVHDDASDSLAQLAMFIEGEDIKPTVIRRGIL